MQTTLKSSVTFHGHGLHTGAPVTLELRPAMPNSGIVFLRTDLAGEQARLSASWDRVIVSPLNTRLANEAGTTVSTIEHIMAALAGCGVHNAVVALDGPEVPIMDGSSSEFVQGIIGAGVVSSGSPLRAIEILKPVRVQIGDASATLTPATSLQIEVLIDFADAAIGQQRKSLNLANGAFVRELSTSRTFCRQSDVDVMRSQGFALGGSLDNAVVVDGGQILNPGGLRHEDEAVRHKMLDVLGDLMTAGAPILGRYVGVRSGHAVTNALLRALFADRTAWRWVVCDPQIAARLPGVGVTKADLAAVA